MEYAPIVVFVYKRPDQTQKTIESLMNNELAKLSELFIYSDGPRGKEEEDSIRQVRSYIHSKQVRDAFKKVVIKEETANRGLANSIIAGVSEVISEKKKVIVVEDDLETSPYFLNYMNECLDFYQKSSLIWSISGYSPKLKCLNEYDESVYLSYRASTWGWGTWLDRWEMIDWEVKDYQKFRYNLKRRILLSRGGNDMPSMLKAQMRGKIDSWGIRWCYNQSKNNMMSIAPRISLIRNNGFDGSGTHSSIEDENRFRCFELENKKRDWLIGDLKRNKQICREFYFLNSISMWKRIQEKVKELYKR